MPCDLLNRIAPDQNMARFYRVSVTPDLFGAIMVERRWGRIGGRGQGKVSSYPSIRLAEAAASALVSAKLRRGYRRAAI